jgi:hypothetical protein
MDGIIGSLGELALAEKWTPSEQQQMEAELLRGHHARRAIIQAEAKEATRQATEFREHHHKKTFWKPVLSIPQQEFMEIVDQHGHSFFNDRANIRWIQNKFPEFRGAKV